MTKDKAYNGFSGIAVKDSLGTALLLAECRLMIGRDILGRWVPGYAVIHRAVSELHTKLEAEHHADSNPTA